MKKGAIILSVLILTLGLLFFYRKKTGKFPFIGRKKVETVQINRRGDVEIVETKEVVEFKSSPHKVGACHDAITGTELVYTYELVHVGDFSLNIGMARYAPIISINMARSPHTEVFVGFHRTATFGIVNRL